MNLPGYFCLRSKHPTSHALTHAGYSKNVIRYALRQRESRYVTVDDGANYVTFHELNVCIIIAHSESLVRLCQQVDFKARFYDIQLSSC